MLEEARFFGIDGVVKLLEDQVSEERKEATSASLTRDEVLRAILSTSVNTELRFQGVNLDGADLQRLDLRNINFKV